MASCGDAGDIGRLANASGAGEWAKVTIGSRVLVDVSETLNGVRTEFQFIGILEEAERGERASSVFAEKIRAKRGAT